MIKECRGLLERWLEASKDTFFIHKNCIYHTICVVQGENVYHPFEGSSLVGGNMVHRKQESPSMERDTCKRNSNGT